MSQEIAGDAPETIAPDAIARAPVAAPVEASERISSVDVLRGFALLGILLLNIVGFAHHPAAYDNPTIAGGAMAAEKPADGLDYRNHRTDRMQYRTLGRTKFVCSRLVFGGGAALSGGRAVRLLDRAFDAGINHYDLGSNAYYKQAENAFADFYKAHKGEIWVTSKAPVRPIALKPGESVTVDAVVAGLVERLSGRGKRTPLLRQDHGRTLFHGPEPGE